MTTPMHERFLKAYDSYADAIFRHCFYRVYHHELAKDLTQQTFMKVWQYLAEGHTVEHLRALLYTTATRLVIDEVRKRKPTCSLENLEETGFEPSTNPRPSLEGRLDGDRLIPFLEHLDDDERELIVLRYIDDLSPKEIALIVNQSANVISVRLHRSLKKLRSLLPPSYAFPLSSLFASRS